MRVYETVTTHHLQEKAQALGYQLDIRVIEPSEDSFYFLTAVKGEKLREPAPLGWTDEQAIDTLKRGTWKSGLLDTF